MNDRTLTLAVSGKLWEGSLVMIDEETETLWSHILGEAMQGPLVGETLENIPLLTTTWAQWKELHPDTTVMAIPRSTGRHMVDAWMEDDGLGIGLELDGRARFWDYTVMRRNPVQNDRLGRRRVLAYFHDPTKTAAIYDRRLKTGRTLHFKNDHGVLVDTQTQSTWNGLSGKATSGELEGAELQRLPGISTDAAAWDSFHPVRPITIEPQGAGMHEQVVTIHGEEVRFTIHVPTNYDDDHAVPLVVALHFGGEVTPFYGRQILEGLVEPALRELNAIMVAPDSLNGPWSSAENEQAILALFDAVAENYNVDCQKTLLTGFSMGGHGSWTLGGKHQDLFQAIIPIAARPAGPTDWTSSLYVIHSKADEVVPYPPAASHAKMLEANGVDVTFITVDDLTHFQTAKFGAHLKQAVPWIRKTWKTRLSK